MASASTASGNMKHTKRRLPLPVFLYLLTAIIPVWFDIGPLNMSAMRALLIIMLIPMIFGVFSGRYGPVLLTDKVFVLYIIWATIAMIKNTPSEAVEFAGSFTVEFLGGYLLARAYIRNAADFRALCYWFALAVLASLPFAILEAKTGHPIILNAIRSLPGIRAFLEVDAEPRWGLFRAQVTFAHPIHYGLFCSIGFSLSLIAMKGSFSTAFRLLAASGAFLGVFLSLSSGAYMSIAMQLALIFWALIFHRVSFRWLIMLGLLAVLYVLIDALSTRTPIRVFMTYAAFSPRTAYWRGLIFEYGMNNVWANPLFGLGLNQWARPSFMVSGSMDNFWLLEAVRYGIPAFLLLTTGYFWAMWKIGRRNFADNNMLWHMRRGWMFTFIGLSITLCTVAIWSSLYSFTFFMFGAGMWMLNARADEDVWRQHTSPLGGDDTHSQTESVPRPVGDERFTRFSPGTKPKDLTRPGSSGRLRENRS